jgi:hypothetical protein
MKTSITIILFLIVSVAHGQNMFETKNTNCNATAFFLEGKEISAAKDLSALLTEILSPIEASKVEELRGIIKLQIFVDSLGNACCVSMQNEMNKAAKKIDFANIISQNTRWTTPIREGKSASICTIIILEFTNDKIIIQRQGFNTKLGGYIVLASFELLK